MTFYKDIDVNTTIHPPVLYVHIYVRRMYIGLADFVISHLRCIS